MRQSSVLKSLIVLAGVAAVGGAVRLGFRHTSEVRGDTEPLGPLSATYTHAEPGVSFRYPGSFRVSELPHGEGSETVPVEDPAHARQGFQVFTQPFDDAEPLTDARIKQDQPHITMESVAPFDVAGGPGISFVQFQTPDVGKTYEVWFVHDHTLYEVATYAERAADLNAILATWSFHP
jgi:hypothetical protein